MHPSGRHPGRRAGALPNDQRPAVGGSSAGRSHAFPSPSCPHTSARDGVGGRSHARDVPFWLERGARQAVAMCPALALRVEPGTPLPASGRPAIAGTRTLVSGGGGVVQG